MRLFNRKKPVTVNPWSSASHFSVSSDNSVNPFFYSNDYQTSEQPGRSVTKVDVAELDQYCQETRDFTFTGSLNRAHYGYDIFDGSKFVGGFGATQLQLIDYWTLRHRSAQLFNENMYARGLIRRLITNEINTGLCLESMPEEMILGMPEDSLNDWSENVENRFQIWAKNPMLCDYYGLNSFGAIQAMARMESYISGDCLVVVRINNKTGLPQIQLIGGNNVRSPIGVSSEVNMQHGIEMDEKGGHIAFHVMDKHGESMRIAARGPRSGRRMAWMVYGTEKRLDEVRGVPILSLIMQSLKEIDRYRDSTQRKAVINSIISLFIKKTADKPGTLPITGGAVRRDQFEDSEQGTQTPRKFDITSLIPGMVLEELQTGEEPVAFGNQGTDTSFGTFEASMISGMAWALQIPPEIATLAFSNNYSASQAAINEFKIFLNKCRTEMGDNFCQPIYTEWLLSQVMADKIEAPGFLDSFRDMNQYDIYGAWLTSDWSGAIKPSTDILKQANGYKVMSAEGWITNERASRELTGTKFSKNIRRIKRENQKKIDAMREIAEFNQQMNAIGGNDTASPDMDSNDPDNEMPELDEVSNG